MGTRTTNWQLYKPTLSETGWGDEVNVNFDDIENGLSAITNVKAPAFGAVGNGSNDDTVEIQAAIDATAAGGTVYFPPGVYLISAPLVVREYRTLTGGMILAANNETTNARPQIRMASGATVGTWGRKAMITHAYYNGTAGENGATGAGPISVRGLYLNGNSNTAGSGIVAMGSANVIENCLINGFAGTSTWGVTGTTGSGYGIVLTTTKYDGSLQASAQVNSWVKRCRIGCNNNKIFVQKNGVAGGVTDWVFEDIVCLIPPSYAHSNSDILVEGAGGGLMRHIHTNGSAGHGIEFSTTSVGMTRVVECYLDGFGQGNGSGNYAAIKVGSFSVLDGGAGSGLSISDININHRTVVSATSYTGIAAAMSNAAELTISGVTNHVQATSGTHYMFDITGSAGIATITNCIAQDGAGGSFVPLNDARIFRSSLSGVTVRAEGNSWQYGTAAPTTGQWGVGMKRWDSTPVSGTPMGWTCSAAGSPGTWLSMANFA